MKHEIEGDEIPVSEARPGDWIFPAPFQVKYLGDETVQSKDRVCRREYIARVIRPRGPLEIGKEAVFTVGPAGRSAGYVIAIHNGWAWLDQAIEKKPPVAHPVDILRRAP